MPCTGLNVTNAAPAKNIMLIILWLFGLQVWIYLPLTWLTSRGFRVVSCLWLPTGWSCRSICGLRWAKWLQTWQPWLEKWWVEVLFLTPTHGPMMLYQNLSIHWASVMKNVFGADGPHTVLCIQCQNCDLFFFFLLKGAITDCLISRLEHVWSPTPAVWPTSPSIQHPRFRSWEQRRPCSGTGAPPPCWGKKWLQWWQGWAGAELGDWRRPSLLWSDPARPNAHPQSEHPLTAQR